MFKITRKQTRPDTTVQFWNGQNSTNMTDDFRNYFYETYVLTGKFISASPVVSEDGLELTTTSIWNSESDYLESRNDPVCIDGLYGKSAEHKDANSIATEEIERVTF